MWNGQNKEQYLANMRATGTYADAFIVSAAAVYLDITIRLVSVHGVELIQPPDGGERIFTMGYLVNKHFYAAVPVTGEVPAIIVCS